MSGNVLLDLHHSDLYYSLYLLFEERLGYKLYRPIGLEWKSSGYWKHFTDGPYGSTSPCLKDCESVPSDDEDGVYYCYSQQQDYYQRAITLEKFKQTKFDIIISTLPCHWVSFNKLIADLQPQAKHIAQIGNIGPDWLDVPVKNVMVSVTPTIFKPKDGQNCVYYNQEFSTYLFRYHQPLIRPKTVSSFIHCLPEKKLWEEYRKALPDFKFDVYGVGNERGFLYDLRMVAFIMECSTFVWQVKPNDGYGHILHNALASGRPVITRLSDYPHRKNLLIPGVSCIDIGGKDFESIKMIRDCSEPEVHKRMCEETHKIFEENVDFDKEEEKVKEFLGRLQ